MSGPPVSAAGIRFEVPEQEMLGERVDRDGSGPRSDDLMPAVGLGRSCVMIADLDLSA
jgi:hypothetical protein